MSAQIYFRLSLVIPLISPWLAYFLDRIIYSDSPVSNVVLALLQTLKLGGLPYLVLAFLLLRWMRLKEAEKIRDILFFTPFIYTLFYGLALLIYMIIQEKLDEFFPRLYENFLVILYIGYIYVIIINIGYSGLRLLNVIKSRH